MGSFRVRCLVRAAKSRSLRSNASAVLIYKARASRPGLFDCMKLWLAKNSEIPIKEQLIAQVRVAVAAGDLKAGDRLPSTREIARRFAVHPNTVSAAYRELARLGDVVKRNGSGVFVADSNDVLDGLIDTMLTGAESHGIDRQAVLLRVQRRLDTLSVPAGVALDKLDGLFKI